MLELMTEACGHSYGTTFMPDLKLCLVLPQVMTYHTQQACNAPGHQDAKVDAQVILCAEDYGAGSLDLFMVYVTITTEHLCITPMYPPTGSG
jgi:hypothetical protein